MNATNPNFPTAMLLAPPVYFAGADAAVVAAGAAAGAGAGVEAAGATGAGA